ncbi:MAG: hypothetical protein IBX50_19265, partial [Marinospirillum sp.]|nr:hypothetical protein [Marinospirillum sp.]
GAGAGAGAGARAGREAGAGVALTGGRIVSRGGGWVAPTLTWLDVP